jgi:hypothetical protein
VSDSGPPERAREAGGLTGFLALTSTRGWNVLRRVATRRSDDSCTASIRGVWPH